MGGSFPICSKIPELKIHVIILSNATYLEHFIRHQRLRFFLIHMSCICSTCNGTDLTVGRLICLFIALTNLPLSSIQVVTRSLTRVISVIVGTGCERSSDEQWSRCHLQRSHVCSCSKYSRSHAKGQRSLRGRPHNSFTAIPHMLQHCSFASVGVWPAALINLQIQSIMKRLHIADEAILASKYNKDRK